MLFQTNVWALSLKFFFFFEDHKNSFTDTLIFLGDDLTLCEIEIADGEDIFVWNGVEVNKCWRNVLRVLDIF